nr:uncharacterized protein LOC121502723 [Drosophila kikkawai]
MVMAIFDPFGLIADYHISAKIIVQSTWSFGTSWDEAIPPELHPKWKSWLAEIHKMHNFKVPRIYSPNLNCCERLEMHIFVDASQEAFAAVAYLRIVCPTVVDIAFVMGKTRLAPKKLLSVPRLELQAAVLGIRLNRLLQQNHKLPIDETFFWSASKTVLQWVRSKTRKFKPFVSHRITEILSSSTELQWNWVPSSNNSADAATRLSNSPKISSQSPWILGPSFLKLPRCDWPRSTDITLPDVFEEEVPEHPVLRCQVVIPIIEFNRFSSYSNLKRVIGWVMRAKGLWLKRSDKKGPLTVQELADAEIEICRMVQQEAFPEEIKNLRNQQIITKQSPIYELSPYIETDGLLHLSGRIDEASFLPQPRRRPILLPKDHRVSYLIMRHFHTKYHHQNQAVIINESRQKFWIPHVKRLLSKVMYECNRCILDRSVPKTPRMGQLPPDRLTPYVRPFTYTGVDLFGPLTVTVGRRHEKRWGVIFT